MTEASPGEERKGGKRECRLGRSETSKTEKLGDRRVSDWGEGGIDLPAAWAMQGQQREGARGWTNEPKETRDGRPDSREGLSCKRVWGLTLWGRSQTSLTDGSSGVVNGGLSALTRSQGKTNQDRLAEANLSDGRG